MGYGLVELPRTAWNKSVPGHVLSHTFFKIAKLSTEKEDTEEALSDTLQVFNRFYYFDALFASWFDKQLG